MASLLIKPLTLWWAALALTACASSAPSNFEYRTSLRGEQGFIGRADRIEAEETLLSAGVVTNPIVAMRAALPHANVRVSKWGLRYFDANWARYQVVLRADIGRGDDTIKCREVSTKTPVGAPTLNELLDNNGAELQAQLNRLTLACISKAANPTP